MTLLRDDRYSWYSFVLLRPKNIVKLSTQSADKWICMGKWHVPSGAIYFHHVVVVRFVPFFNTPLLAKSSADYFEKTFFEGAGAKIIITGIERSIFRQVTVFWDLLPKTQSALTPARGSSLDSRKSSYPFNT